jgi:hypothetical protein
MSLTMVALPLLAVLRMSGHKNMGTIELNGLCGPIPLK